MADSAEDRRRALYDAHLKVPLEVYALGEEGRWREVRVYRDDARVRAAPFDAIELELAALWSPPRVAQ